jgi:hypothetical protein
MKGIGKGVIGAIARPVAGVVDATTGTLDSVKKYIFFQPNIVVIKAF